MRSEQLVNGLEGLRLLEPSFTSRIRCVKTHAQRGVQLIRLLRSLFPNGPIKSPQMRILCTTFLWVFPIRIPLDEGLRAQIGMQLNGLFRNYENIFYQWREGAIGDDVWKGWSAQMLGVYWTPLAQVWWPTWREYCHDEFCLFLETSSKPNVLVTAGWPSDSTIT